MAQNLKVCDLDEALAAKLKKLRFRKELTSAAVVMKIDAEKMTVIADPAVDDEETEDVTPEDVAGLLPTHQPRYVAYSYAYKHDDGRTSYPLCFIFVSPPGCKPEMQMMYAGSKLGVVKDCGFTKVFELRSAEDLTEDWLRTKLHFFR
ncbi:Glia maturation factor beta [Geodia barretti]|uniref:Glia maturation factor beta n=1 Tax=Geodia barretti TaxID=519541 RepID=A0AA35RDX0_GEOBA|nr:Glia maturation factor beta [Geodia barretti]